MANQQLINGLMGGIMQPGEMQMPQANGFAGMAQMPQIGQQMQQPMSGFAKALMGGVGMLQPIAQDAFGQWRF